MLTFARNTISPIHCVGFWLIEYCGLFWASIDFRISALKYTFVISASKPWSWPTLKVISFDLSHRPLFKSLLFIWLHWVWLFGPTGGQTSFHQCQQVIFAKSKDDLINTKQSLTIVIVLIQSQKGSNRQRQTDEDRQTDKQKNMDITIKVVA